MKLQIVVFIGMAIGLILLYIGSIGGSFIVPLLFLGFAIYNLLINMGPNVTTFILPAELFPTSIRATAHGFAAGIAKLGTALGIVIVPLINDLYGISTMLLVMLILTIIAIMITILFKIETTGRSLEEISSNNA